MHRHEQTEGTINFLRAEIEAANAFIAIARRTNYRDKFTRNLANARKVCKSTRYFMDRVPLSQDGVDEISEKLATVEGELAVLEESV